MQTLAKYKKICYHKQADFDNDKNGLMVKRLRRCPLTAESAVRFRMGLPKKETTPLVVLFLFFSTPLSGTTRQLVCRRSYLRQQILP